MNSTCKYIQLIMLILFTGLASSCSDDEAEYTGILEHRPEGKDGMWVISGQSFSVSDEVDLDDHNGPLTAGACVELEMEDGDVTEIESEDMDKCLPKQK